MKANRTFLTWMTTAFMFVLFSLFGANLRAQTVVTWGDDGDKTVTSSGTKSITFSYDGITVVQDGTSGTFTPGTYNVIGQGKGQSSSAQPIRVYYNNSLSITLDNSQCKFSRIEITSPTSKNVTGFTDGTNNYPRNANSTPNIDIDLSGNPQNSITLSTYGDTKGNIAISAIKFTYACSSGGEPGNECAAPSNPTTASGNNLTSTTAKVSWSAASSTPSDGYIVKCWETDGGSEASATANTTSELNYTFTGLTSGTSYSWSVKSDCGSGSTSEAVTGIFTTLSGGSGGGNQGGGEVTYSNVFKQVSDPATLETNDRILIVCGAGSYAIDGGTENKNGSSSVTITTVDGVQQITTDVYSTQNTDKPCEFILTKHTDNNTTTYSIYDHVNNLYLWGSTTKGGMPVGSTDEERWTLSKGASAGDMKIQATKKSQYYIRAYSSSSDFRQYSGESNQTVQVYKRQVASSGGTEPPTPPTPTTCDNVIDETTISSEVADENVTIEWQLNSGATASASDFIVRIFDSENNQVGDDITDDIDEDEGKYSLITEIEQHGDYTYQIFHKCADNLLSEGTTALEFTIENPCKLPTGIETIADESSAEISWTNPTPAPEGYTLKFWQKGTDPDAAQERSVDVEEEGYTFKESDNLQAFTWYRWKLLVNCGSDGSNETPVYEFCTGTYAITTPTSITKTYACTTAGEHTYSANLFGAIDVEAFNLAASTEDLGFAVKPGTHPLGLTATGEVLVEDQYATGTITLSDATISANTDHAMARTLSDTVQIKEGDNIIGTLPVTVNVTYTAMPAVGVSPNGGNILTTDEITLSSVDGAVIYYTLDGSDPKDADNTERKPYSEAFKITETGSVTLKAIAELDPYGWDENSMTSVTFNVDYPTLPAPEIAITDGDCAPAKKVSITAAEGATIYYSLDGNDPDTEDENSIWNGTAVDITATTTVKAIAVKTGMNNSPVAQTSVSIVLVKDFLPLQNFSSCTGTSEISNIGSKLSGWSGTKVFADNGSIKLGNSSTNGNIQTPALTGLEGDYIVSFKAKAFQASNGTIETITVSSTDDKNSKKLENVPTDSYKEFTLRFEEGSSTTKVKFSAEKRGYLDDIRIYQDFSPVLTVKHGDDEIAEQGAVELESAFTGEKSTGCISISGENITRTVTAELVGDQASLFTRTMPEGKSAGLLCSDFNNAAEYTLNLEFTADEIASSDLSREANLVLKMGDQTLKTIRIQSAVKVCPEPEASVNRNGLDASDNASLKVVVTEGDINDYSYRYKLNKDGEEFGGWKTIGQNATTQAWEDVINGLGSKTSYAFEIRRRCAALSYSDPVSVSQTTVKTDAVILTITGVEDAATHSASITGQTRVNFELTKNYSWGDNESKPYAGKVRIEIASLDEEDNETPYRNVVVGENDLPYLDWLPTGKYKASLQPVKANGSEWEEDGALEDYTVPSHVFNVNWPDVATPVISPRAYIDYDSTVITITCPTPDEDATIYYSFDDENYEVYDPDHKPWVKTSGTTVYAYAEKEHMDRSAKAQTTEDFVITPLYKVATIADLRDESATTGKVYRIDGEVVVTHKDDYNKRIWVQDKEKEGGKSILLYGNTEENYAVVSGEGVVLKEIIGTMAKNGKVWQFTPVTFTLTGETGREAYIDTLRLDEITEEHQSALVCVKFVSFSGLAANATFAKGKNYDITDKAGHSEKVRTDFNNVGYIGGTIPTGDLYITGLVNPYNNNIQFFVRKGEDFAAAPAINATTAKFDTSVYAGAPVVKTFTYSATAERMYKPVKVVVRGASAGVEPVISVNAEELAAANDLSVVVSANGDLAAGTYTNYVDLVHDGDVLATTEVKITVQTCPVLAANDYLVSDSVTSITVEVKESDLPVKYGYRFAEANTEEAWTAAVEQFVTPDPNNAGSASSFFLNNLTYNTTRFYQIRRYCAVNATSEWTEAGSKTTATPSITITSPQNNESFTEPGKLFNFAFTTTHVHLGDKPADAPANHLPYAKVKAEFFAPEGENWKLLDAYTVNDSTASPIQQWLPSLKNGNYKVQLTLVTDPMEGVANANTVAQEVFGVQLSDAAVLPTITAAAGPYYNTTGPITLSQEGVTDGKIFYSTDGKTYTEYTEALPGFSATTTLYVKGWQPYYDTSNVTSAIYTIVKRNDVATAAELYGDAYTAAAAKKGELSDDFYRITGNLVITHKVTNSQNKLRQRFFVQDEGISKTGDDKRSLLIDPQVFNKLSQEDFAKLEAGQRIKNITGKIKVSRGMLVFEPVDEALTLVEGDKVALHIDTLTIDQIKNGHSEGMKRYQGALVCIKHVSFIDEDKGVNFTDNKFYTMQGRTGTIRFRTDFYEADYITEATPVPYGTELYVTGLMTQSTDEATSNSVIRITARNKADMALAPSVTVSPKIIDLGTLYTVSATDATAPATATVTVAHHEGKAEVKEFKDEDDCFAAALNADGDKLTVTYTYSSAKVGEHKAVYALDFVEASDTLKVSAVTKLCEAPVAADFKPADVTSDEAAVQFDHTMTAFMFDTTSVATGSEPAWHEGATGTAFTGTRFTLSQLNPSTTYYYRVKTVCVTGDEAAGIARVESAWSTFEADKTQFTTKKGDAKTIQLTKPTGEKITGDGEVVISYKTSSTLNINDENTYVELLFENRETHAEVLKEYDGSAADYTTHLPSGKYTLTATVKTKTGEDTYTNLLDEGETITSSVDFEVDLQDVAAPVISAKPAYTAVAGNYYDSVEVVITAAPGEDNCTLFYRLDPADAWTKYTDTTELKFKENKTVYALAKKQYRDSTEANLALKVVTDAVNVTCPAQHTHVSNLLAFAAWTEPIEITALYLRDDIQVSVRPEQGKTPAIAVTEDVITRNTKGESTSSDIHTVAAENVKVGRYHDTIILTSQGVEIARIKVDFTVTGYRIPAVTAQPESGVSRKGSVAVTLTCPEGEHTGAKYDIYYTLNGDKPTATASATNFTYNPATGFTITNDTTASTTYTVKALAFDPQLNDTTPDAAAVFTYTLTNDARLQGDAKKDYTLTRLQTLSQTLNFTPQFVTGTVAMTVKPGLEASAAVVTAVMTPGATPQDAFSVALSTAAGLAPGTYSDTLVFTSTGVTMLKTAVNVTVTAFRTPAVVMTPNGGDVMDTNRVEVVMNLASTGKSAAGYEIRYTVDGSTPTLTNGVLYTAPSDTLFKPADGAVLTVKALAFDKAGYDTAHADSLCMAVFEFKTTPVTPPAPDTVSAPRLTPNGGTFADSVWVKMACDTAGATIKYRLGSTGAFALFVDSLKLTQSCMVEAFAEKAGLVNSDTVKVAFTVTATPVTPPEPPTPAKKDTVAAPRLTPNGGTFADSVWVKMVCDTAGAVIKYRLGSTGAFAVFADSVKLTQSCMVEAFAEKSGLVNSDTVKVSFTVNKTTPVTPPTPVVKDTVAAPRITPNGGTFADSVEVTLACDTVGATIFYRTASTANFAAYNGKFKLYASCTVEAYAAKDSLVNSAVVSAAFTITKTEPVVPVAPDTVKAPVIAPNGGSFEKEVEVTITCATPGAKIMYSLDGGELDVVYTEPLKLTTSCTLKAIAVKDSMVNSAVVSAEFTITGGTGVGSEEVAALKAALYPNPTTGRFFVELSEDALVEVFNGSGVRVMSEKMTSGKHEVNLTAMPAGIYFVKATSFSGKQSVTKRVVVR